MEKLKSNPDYMKRLKETILKSGFPLELETDDVLREHNWGTFPSMHFIDEDEVERKQREIDNFALFPHDESLDKIFEPLGVSPHLVIECKKLDQVSAVILRGSVRTPTHYDFSGQTYDFTWLMERRVSGRIPDEFHLGHFLTRAAFHYRAFTDRIGVGMGMKPDDTSEAAVEKVRGGIMQLVKAQAYHVAVSIQRDKTIQHPYYPFYFGFLTLVIDGGIVEVERRGSDIALEEVRHGVVKASYKPVYSDEILSYLIDVVRKDYLETYLELLLKDRFKLARTIEGDKERLVEYQKRRKATDIF